MRKKAGAVLFVEPLAMPAVPVPGKDLDGVAALFREVHVVGTGASGTPPGANGSACSKDAAAADRGRRRSKLHEAADVGRLHGKYVFEIRI